jgi:small subunit ribosomal protein S9
MTATSPFTWGLGRRKTAVARVRIRPGSGGFQINGKAMEEFFPCIEDRTRVLAPLKSTESNESYDVFCNVSGGGHTGQSGAVMLGLARALKTHNVMTFETLRDAGLLTRDSRMKERKKYGRRGARRGFQFSKR